MEFQTNRTRKWLVSSALAAGVMVGAAGIAAAATGSSTPAADSGSKATATSNAASQGNEDATHEASEDPAREAAEKNGTAFGGHDGDHGRGGDHGSETPLTGVTADKVTAAALAAVPGATVSSVESDSSGDRYEANVVKSDGTEVKVMLDKSFKVLETDANGDHGDHGDQGADETGA